MSWIDPWINEYNRRTLRREYFNQPTAPTSIRDTMGGALTALYAPPFLRLTYSGNTNNQIKEYKIESNGEGDVLFHSHGGSNDLYYERDYECFLWAGLLGPSPGATAVAGIEVYSHEANPPFSSTPIMPIIQLYQRMDDSTQYAMKCAPGNFVAAQIQTAVVPSSANNQGKKLRINIDPSTRVIKGFVDEVLLFSFGSNVYPDYTAVVGTIGFGLFMTSGLPGGVATTLQSQFTSPVAIHHNVTSVGTEPV